MRALNVTPHVAQNTTSRRSAIDGRTTRHAGYETSQQKRKRVEEPFGWGKTIGRLARPMLRGIKKLDFKVHPDDGRLRSRQTAKIDRSGRMNAADQEKLNSASSEIETVPPPTAKRSFRSHFQRPDDSGPQGAVGIPATIGRARCMVGLLEK